MRASVEKVIPGPFKNLKELLQEWTWLNRDIARSWRWEDCPWWCNERASISTLAGAAWNAGGIALEEYASRKLKGNKKTLGRCDIYFRIKNNGYVAEAKHCWLRANVASEKMSEKVRKYLSSACNDATGNTTSLYRNETLVGIAFVVPYIHQSEIESGTVGERIKEVQDVLLGIANKECALAWIFPRGSREMVAEDDNFIYPGTAILIKQVPNKKE